MKKITAFLMIFIIIGLTGCAKDTVTLTDEQNDMVAEYIAGVVLRHDANYEDTKLILTGPEPVAEETIHPTPEPTTSTGAMASPAPGETSPTPSAVTPTTESVVQLNDVFASSDYKVSFTGCKFFNSYPESIKESDFSLIAQDGNQLLVVDFIIENISGKEQHISLLEKNIKYILYVDGDPIAEASLTPLLDDMQYLDITLASKEKQNTVIVFEVSKQIDLNQVDLRVMGSDASAIIDIK